MVPATYRLDALSVLLISRLEPARRTYVDNPAAARDDFRRIVEGHARPLAAECLETLGDVAQARRIEHEAMETFLPRYTRLALAQNAAESKGFGFFFGEGPLARVAATAAAFAVAALLSRVIHHWIDIVFFASALLVPFAPEARLWWSRRAYRAQLQEFADDMARIQDTDQAMASVPVSEPAVHEPRPRSFDKEVP